MHSKVVQLQVTYYNIADGASKLSVGPSFFTGYRKTAIKDVITSIEIPLSDQVYQLIQLHHYSHKFQCYVGTLCLRIITVGQLKRMSPPSFAECLLGDLQGGE